MGCPTECVIGDNLTFSISTHDADTGVLTDAAAAPIWRLYEDETTTPILTGTMAKLDDANTTGFYTETVACTLGNGFEVGKTYTIYIEATVDGDTGGITFAFKAVVAVADAVWDELLTGAAHNDPTSAGRRLRQLNDFGVYEGGAVWFDSVNGTGGTTEFENGTVGNPSNSEADVTALLTSLGYTKIRVVSGATYTLEVAYTNKTFEGDNWTLLINGQSYVGCTFIGGAVSGIGTGAGSTQQFIRCLMGATSHIKGTHLIACGLSGTQTITEAGEYFIDSCHSAVAGMGSVTWDFGALLAASNLNVRHHSGGWTIENMGAGAGTYEASFEGFGQIIWAASCSATSNASIRGHWRITDNASGAVTVTFDDLVTDVNTIQADLPTLPTKNVALAGFPFLMVLTSDHVTGATGLSVTAERSLDGAAFAACANAVAEVANGVYTIDLAATDMNADTVMLKFTAALADARFIAIVTQAT